MAVKSDTQSDLVESLDAWVCEQVRRGGVDLQGDTVRGRRIAEDVIRRHDDHSLTGAVLPVADPVAMVGQLVARVAGFGALQTA